MNKNLIFRQLFDHETWSYTYLLADAESKEAILIDPVKEQAERDLALLADLGLQLKYVLDTHVHADHITGAAKLKAATGARSGVSRVAGVRAAELALEDGQELSYGNFRLKVLATPGHTDTCLSFYSEGMVFTGDTLFVRDVGRTDFQQGSNEKMFASVREKLFVLPPETYVYPAHDYKGMGVSTIAEEMRLNPKVGMKNSFEEFREKMEAMKLAPPKRLQIAVPANLRGGAEEGEG
jgi:glyoxylase-like metal-dependent hydrolase (beta-lactamase superfamily II)